MPKAKQLDLAEREESFEIGPKIWRNWSNMEVFLTKTEKKRNCANVQEANMREFFRDIKALILISKECLPLVLRKLARKVKNWGS